MHFVYMGFFMAHKKETITVRLPVSTTDKLKALRLWKGEPWYSIIDRLIEANQVIG